jgi:PAS domain-containing protein
MRLEALCSLAMQYVDASWHRPYGADGEGLGFGRGDGAVTGEIEGDLVWANYPRRRQDGVWTPNLRGMIRTRDGRELLVSIHGQSVEERAAGERRAILARVELTSDAEAYRWLNTCFIVGEGEIDEEREHWWLDTYVCVNAKAHGPPAIGVEPPERFR